MTVKFTVLPVSYRLDLCAWLVLVVFIDAVCTCLVQALSDGLLHSEQDDEICRPLWIPTLFGYRDGLLKYRIIFNLVFTVALMNVVAKVANHTNHVAKNTSILNSASLAVSLEKNRFKGLKTCFQHLVFGLDSYSVLLIALKAFETQFTNQLLASASLFLLIGAINAEIILVKRIMEDETAAGGVLVKDGHPHGLFYLPVAKGKNVLCDICKLDYRSTRQGMYYCATCTFTAHEKCLMVPSLKEARKTERGVHFGFLSKDETKLLVSLISPHWLMFTLSCLCKTVGELFILAVPWYETLLLRSLYESNRDLLWSSSSQILFIHSLSGFCDLLHHIGMTTAFERVKASAKAEVTKAVLLQGMEFHDGIQLGKLLALVNNDIPTMIYPIRISAAQLLPLLFPVLAGVAVRLYTSWKLVLFASAIVYPTIYVSSLTTTAETETSESLNVVSSSIRTFLAQTFSNMKIVKVHTAENLETAAAKELFNKKAGFSKRLQWVSATKNLFDRHIEVAADLSIPVLGGLLYMQTPNEIPLVSILAIRRYWSKVFSFYKRLLAVKNAWTKSMKAAQRVVRILRLPLEPVAKNEESLEMNAVKGNIQIRVQSFKYQANDKAVVLQDVDLDIPKHSTVAIVGKSGSGKSTLLHLLMRLYGLKGGRSVFKGTITVDGMDLSEIKPQNLYQIFGFVAQDSKLFASSIADNIAYGQKPSEYDMCKIFQAARRAHAEDFIEKLPDKYNTVVGAGGAKLSGGQIQRICLARCFFRGCKVIILDEPTAALDGENETHVRDALNALVAEASHTVILASHRLSTVASASHIYVLEDGKIVESGTSERLLQKEGTYYRLMKNQLMGAKNI